MIWFWESSMKNVLRIFADFGALTNMAKFETLLRSRQTLVDTLLGSL